MYYYVIKGRPIWLFPDWYKYKLLEIKETKENILWAELENDDL